MQKRMLTGFKSSCQILRVPAIAAVFAVAALAGPAMVSAQTSTPDSQVVIVENSVNINTADAEALALALDGVGLTRALDIIAYREEHGDFKTVDELERVRGIGRATLERNRHKIRITDTGE